MNNMVQLVVSDMDGTLLSEAKKLPADFLETIRGIQSQGITFAVASGRQMYTLQEELFDLKDSIYFVAENGGFMAYRDEIIHLDAIPRENVLEFLAFGRGIAGTFPILCGKDAAYVQDSDVTFLSEAHKYFRRLEMVEDLTQVQDDIVKFTLYDNLGAESNSMLHFATFADRFKVTVGAVQYLDVTNLSANKGTALEMLQSKLGVSCEHTMVFGDYLNDFEMMQRAKYSYAMKNAHPQILEAARFVTQFDNNEAGVTRTIRELLLD